MPPHDDRFAPVMAALAADPSSPFGEPGAQVDVLRRMEGPFSSVRRMRVRIGSRTIHAYAKIIRPRGDDEDAAAMADRFVAREHQATRALYDALNQDAAIGAVRPLAFLPEHRALVTEEVPGRPFGALLLDSSWADADLLAVATRVGAWARMYQEVGGPAEPVSLAEHRRYIDHRLELLQGRVLTAAERAAALARFDELAGAIGAAQIPGVAIHADLTPMNVIVGPEGRVTVLDFTMAKSGTTVHDLSHIYFHLDLLAARRRGRTAVLHALQAAMLVGYRSDLSADDPLFRLMLLQHGVCHVALLAERRIPVIDAAYRWFLRRRWARCEQLAGEPRDAAVV